MNSEVWCKQVRALPPRLTLGEAARMLGSNYSTANYWLTKFNYPMMDGRSIRWTEQQRSLRRKIDPKLIDWNHSIAWNRKHLLEKGIIISRQRLHQIRNKAGKKKVYD